MRSPLDTYERLVLGYCLYTAGVGVVMLWQAITGAVA